jgi:hypothetical protein
MVLHRQIRAPSALKGDVFREVLLDASPFLKREVLAVRENILRFSSTDADSPPIVERRLCPVVVLAHVFCSAADKAMAMLHAVWLEYGLEKRSTVAAMEGAYENYVPLHRDEAEQAGIPAHPIGSGLSTRGSSTKRASSSITSTPRLAAEYSRPLKPTRPVRW